MATVKEYRVDPKRKHRGVETGYVVRALDGSSYRNADISTLDRDSLWRWLLSRENAKWPAQVVMSLLGHERMTEEEQGHG